MSSFRSAFLAVSTAALTATLFVGLSGTSHGLDLDKFDLVWGPRDVISAWHRPDAREDRGG